jgi:flavin reductase (DIM6/NTAB) family NADH-FMN oxidoreductase RutF
MAASRDDFKRALSQHPAGVVVLATTTPSGPYATTATAFASLSVEPPLVLAALRTESRLLARVCETRQLGVSFLTADHEEIAVELARREGKSCDKVEWLEVGGVPAVPGYRVLLTTVVDRLVPGGDHQILICSVTGVHMTDHSTPALVYHGREYRSL